MHDSMPRTQHDPQPQRQRAADELVPAVARELSSALASLRAALEGIALEFDDSDPRLERVRRAVVQTIPIARQVEALVDCTESTPLQEMACSLKEIASSVRSALRGSGSPPLLLAMEDAGSRFRVDGPLLVRAIALFGEQLGQLGQGHLLLRARLERGAPSFTLVWTACAGEQEMLALQRRLLRHEALRLGARFEESLAPDGCARIELRFPATRHEKAAE
jgi:hypothetical protein